MTYQKLVVEFLKIYGGSEDGIRIFEAPGRINLIGEHIDYNGGHVFPAALDMTDIIIARINKTNKINMAVTSLPDRVSADINALCNYRHLNWGSYQCGVAYVMQQEGYPIIGCDLLYHGDIPYGAGLSSSAAIEVSTAIALAKLGGREKLDMVDIALLCQKAENEYVGMNCGIMDQFVSAIAKKGQVLFLNCNTLDCKHIPFDLGKYTIVITNTNAPHKLNESQYNQRRSECEQALGIINENGGDYPHLCSINMQELERYKRFFGNEQETLYRRALHCVTEEARTVASLAALEKGDIETFGKLLCEANISMRDYYEATGKELDTVFDIALNTGGVIGSRMTGGGFGGCNISIIKEDKVSHFKKTMKEEYTRIIGYTPSFYRFNAGQGAREVVKWR